MDVGIRVTANITDQSLVARRLLDLEVQLFASPRYLARGRTPPKRPEDLKEHAVIGFELGSLGSAEWTLQKERSSARVPLAPKIVVDEFTCAKAMLMAGGGIGVLPSFVAASALAVGDLVRVLPEWSVARAPVYLIHAGGTKPAARISAFCNFMFDRFRGSSQL